MEMKLLVVRAFGPHTKGDILSDSGDIAKIIAGQHAGDVVRVGAWAAMDDKTAGNHSVASSQES